MCVCACVCVRLSMCVCPCEYVFIIPPSRSPTTLGSGYIKAKTETLAESANKGRQARDERDLFWAVGGARLFLRVTLRSQELFSFLILPARKKTEIYKLGKT